MTHRLETPELPTSVAETGAGDAELAAVLEAYLAAVESGHAPTANQLCAEHPHLAERLEGCLASLRFLEQAGGDVRNAAIAGSPPDLSDPLATASAADRATLGDFRLVREIGRGGMGIVYEAEQLSLGRRVAVKVLPFAAMLDERQLARFKNEARAAASLHHPHIVPVYYVGAERGVHFYAMQYIEGQSLAEISAGPRSADGGTPKDDQTEASVSADAALGVPPSALETHPVAAAATLPDRTSPAHFRRVAELGVQAAAALHYAHESGVIHRDVKPSNLLVEPRGHLWIADFGLARINAEPTMTLTGDVVGTLRYMSPEQLRGKAAMIDHRTDVYSLGVTLYELLTGRPAFAGENSEQLLRQILDAEPLPPRSRNRAIPTDLETIVLKAIRKDAAERYATAQDLADDLQRFASARPILARPASRMHKVGKWMRRHSYVAWSIGAFLLMATIGSLISATLISHERQIAVAQLAETELTRRRVDENFRDALHTLEWLAARAHAASLGKGPEVRAMQTAAVARVRAFLDPFLQQQGSDPASRLHSGIAYVHLGRLNTAIGDVSRAKMAYLRACRIFRALARERPADPIPRIELAVAETIVGFHLYAHGDLSGGEQHLQRAESGYRECLRLAPRHADALSMSVCLCAMRTKFTSDHALRCQQLLALYIAEQGMDEFAWYLTGAIAYRAGRWQEAVDALNVVVRLSSQERRQLRSQAQLYLAMACWRLGRKAEARLIFTQTVANDSEVRQLYEDNSLLRAEVASLIDRNLPAAQH